MSSTFRENFRAWIQRFGDGWNQFWFSPSSPLTLGVLRVATGLMALYLHFTFSFDLLRFFGPDGLLPAAAVDQWAGEVIGVPDFPLLPTLSYLSYVTHPTTLWVLHGLGFAVLLAFTLGLFSRCTSIASLIVFLSYMHRAPMLVGLVEPVVAMVLFYLCLGPCGASLSLDAWWHNRRSPPYQGGVRGGSGLAQELSPWATVSTRLIQIHLAALCFMMALSKLGGGSSNVWWSGEAVWTIIARPESRLADFTWLAGHPFLLDVWTHAIVWFELLFPLLIWQRWSRPLMLALGVVIWGSLILITGLTTFYFMLLFASLAFVPPAQFRALLEQLPFWRTQPATVAAPAAEALAEDTANSPPPREQAVQRSAKMPRQRAKTK